MLEEIRLYMMEMLFNMKQEARKWMNNVCPGPIKKMDEFAFDIKSWYVHPSGLNAFEVRNGVHSYGVNLEGITRYGKDKFLATYESNILPVNDNNMWEPTPYTKPLPPIERRMPGRPYLGEVVEEVVEEVEEVVEDGLPVLKEPGIETQFVTQTTPNVESQFVTQTAPTVDSEHVPETQEADVKINDEGDGLDVAINHGTPHIGT
uniref:Uncharacterized protein n=1 Tax=Lactuca sativa TaxID=4236 RepID=A0A9R1VGJ1_LACSA|nr:hypothetical protein LSAT_V11C500298380 [Lactuca sativa]